MKDKSLSRATALCLMKAGRYEDAQDLLLSMNGSPGTGQEFSYLLGISYLEQEKYEESLQELLKIDSDTQLKKQAEAPLLALLRRKAILSINQKNWASAGDALGRAITINSNDEVLKQLMKSVEDVVSIAYLKANKRGESVQAWENKLKQEPNHPRIWHHLALVHYCEANHQLGNGNLEAAKTPWQNALAYWGALLSNQSFWDSWTRDRLSVCKVPVEVVCGERIEGLAMIDELNNGGIPGWKKKKVQTAITKLANETQKSVEDKIRGLLSAKLDESLRNDNKATSIYEELIIGFAHEQKTAELFEQIKSQQGISPTLKSLPSCGPQFLSKFGLLKNARKAVEELVKKDELKKDKLYDRLRIYLSPYGQILAAIDEKRFEKAIALAENSIKKENTEPDARTLLALACDGYTEDRAAHRAFEEALDAIAKANSYECMKSSAVFSGAVDLTQRLKDIASKIAQAYERKASAAGTKNEKKAALQDGVALLRTAYKISETVADNLAYMLRTLAAFVFDPDRPDEAISICREAYKVAPENLKVKQELAKELTNRGVNKANKGRLSDALKDLEEAYGLSPGSRYVKEQYSVVLASEGIKKWNNASSNYGWEAGMDLMAKAIEVNPLNKHAVANSIKMLNTAQQNFSLRNSSKYRRLQAAVAPTLLSSILGGG